MDINSASLSELKPLKGVDDVCAKKIVENRPYERKDDLVRKEIIPQNTYDGIKDEIVARKVKAGKSTPSTAEESSSAKRRK